MLRGFKTETDRDIVFIPVALNYDRTLEDRSLIRTLDPHAEKRSKWFVFKTTVGFLWQNLVLRISNQWQRFGFACVNFAPPISAREFGRLKGVDFSRLDRDVRFVIVQELCHQLMASIQSNIPVLPVSLVASVLLEVRQRWLSEFDVKARVHNLMEELQARGAPVYIPTRGLEQAVAGGFNMLKLRRMVDESDGLFRANSESIDILSYYANSMEYWRRPPVRVDEGEQPNDPALTSDTA
jgi:glycerol-3-phosphate O-acyltransferase